MVGVTTAERDLPLFLCVTLIDIGVTRLELCRDLLRFRPSCFTSMFKRFVIPPLPQIIFDYQGAPLQCVLRNQIMATHILSLPTSLEKTISG